LMRSLIASRSNSATARSTFISPASLGRSKRVARHRAITGPDEVRTGR
jgi:hypothetical protein